MVWFTIMFILSAILDIITVSRQSNLEKDLEILILRQQLSILQRMLNSPNIPIIIEIHIGQNEKARNNASFAIYQLH